MPAVFEPREASGLRRVHRRFMRRGKTGDSRMPERAKNNGLR